MFNLKKLKAILFISILFLILAACSNENTSDQEGTNEDEDTKPEISILTPLHSAEVPDEMLEEEIERLTEVELDLQFVPANNFEDRVNTAFATDSMPNVAHIPIEGNFKEAIRDGQFWEIESYLDEFPNLQKLKDDILDNTRVDGKLYSLYQGRPFSRQGMIYRKDWADNLGLDAPTTTDEFMEMARAFTEDDPDGNGEDDTFGLTDRNDLIYGAFKTVSSWFGTPNNWGEKEGQLLPSFMFDEYKQTMDFFKEMQDNGYINQDFPVTSKTDQQEFIINGTAGIYVGSMGDVSPLQNSGIENNSDMELDVHNQVKGPNEEYQVWAIEGYNHPYFFPKSSVETEEELKEILGFFDKMMTPEVSNTLIHGIEGQHYEVEDGYAVPIADETAIATEVAPYKTIEVGEPETNGRYLKAFSLSAAEKAEELIQDNENYLIHDPTITLDSETYDTRKAELETIITDATYNYILGEIDEQGFEEEIDRWREAGGEDAIKEFNQSYQN